MWRQNLLSVKTSSFSSYSSAHAAYTRGCCYTISIASHAFRTLSSPNNPICTASLPGTEGTSDRCDYHINRTPSKTFSFSLYSRDHFTISCETNPIKKQRVEALRAQLQIKVLHILVTIRKWAIYCRFAFSPTLYSKYFCHPPAHSNN